MAMIRHVEQSELEITHSSARFWIQLFSLIAFFGLLGVLLFRLASSHAANPFWALAAFIFGMAVTDLGSGIVHWALDTWGTIRTPLVGPSLIRDFRLHHIDEKEMTLHGILPTIGNAAAAMIPIQIATAFISLDSVLAASFVSFLISITFWTVMTNQIHKWAHLDLEKIPPVPRFFQKAGIFLAPGPHHVHHIEPFTQSYCITTGWCNPLLSRIQFFRHLERFLAKATGAVPRTDDIGIEAATELAKSERILG